MMIAGGWYSRKFYDTVSGVDTFANLGKDYFKQLDSRGKKSRAYYSYQFVGLELAVILRDMPHKALYIKLAKEHDNCERLLALAKSVAERRGVNNKGAYFMKLFFDRTK